ncbi:MAG: LysR family transcriptional regulator [Oscillospiraceae bacterium]|jgi:molybdate transport system regulatory protein|nr:LysR family transcriptional regulator [Oscillospiraceae bacterium]
MSTLHPKIKIWLAKDDTGFFGPGTLKLLKQTAKLQSLKAACACMGMSYSKGWKIITNIERELGFAVLKRRQGGRFGGGCVPTAEGEAMMERYEAFAEHAAKLVSDAFTEFFGT